MAQCFSLNHFFRLLGNIEHTELCKSQIKSSQKLIILTNPHVYVSKSEKKKVCWRRSLFKTPVCRSKKCSLQISSSLNIDFEFVYSMTSAYWTFLSCKMFQVYEWDLKWQWLRDHWRFKGHSFLYHLPFLMPLEFFELNWICCCHITDFKRLKARSHQGW